MTRAERDRRALALLKLRAARLQELARQVTRLGSARRRGCVHMWARCPRTSKFVAHLAQLRRRAVILLPVMPLPFVGA